MYRKFKLTILTLILGLFLFQQTAFAQEGPIGQHTDSVWQVSYWNNKTLAGNPVVQTGETNINWDWGMGSPSGLPAASTKRNRMSESGASGMSARRTSWSPAAAGIS